MSCNLSNAGTVFPSQNSSSSSSVQYGKLSSLLACPTSDRMEKSQCMKYLVGTNMELPTLKKGMNTKKYMK